MYKKIVFLIGDDTESIDEFCNIAGDEIKILSTDTIVESVYSSLTREQMRNDAIWSFTSGVSRYCNVITNVIFSAINNCDERLIIVKGYPVNSACAKRCLQLIWCKCFAVNFSLPLVDSIVKETIDNGNQSAYDAITNKKILLQSIIDVFDCAEVPVYSYTGENKKAVISAYKMLFGDENELF